MTNNVGVDLHVACRNVHTTNEGLSLLCSRHPPPPTNLPETGPCILNNLRLDVENNTNHNSKKKKKACGLTVSLMMPLSAKTNNKKTCNELVFADICRQSI